VQYKQHPTREHVFSCLRELLILLATCRGCLKLFSLMHIILQFHWVNVSITTYSEWAYSPSKRQHEFRNKTPCDRHNKVLGRCIRIVMVYHTCNLFEHFISTTTKRILRHNICHKREDGPSSRLEITMGNIESKEKIKQSN
jgi:hypothetical protein